MKEVKEWRSNDEAFGCSWHRSLRFVANLQKWRYGDAETEKNCWKKVIFIFFAYKLYSRHIIKFTLNHWWQMDYPDDAFHTFLGLDSVNCFAVNGTVKSLPVEGHERPLEDTEYVFYLQSFLGYCSSDKQLYPSGWYIWNIMLYYASISFAGVEQSGYCTTFYTI